MRLLDVVEQPASLETRLYRLVNSELDRAQDIWDQVGDQLVVKADSARNFAEALALNSQQTNIPGYPTIDPNAPEVDEFIAFVMDMRDSTNHLLQAISNKVAKVSELQRIFFETSALLPATAEVIRSYNGKVTEYLGDGVLALFRATKDTPTRNQACYDACRAGRYVVKEMRNIINDVIHKRYGLPPIDVGVGMAYSKAVVTVVGHPNERAPKAIGTCIYRATKLADLYNEVVVDDYLHGIWPTVKGGFSFSLRSRKRHEFDSYILPPL